jgi:hypothetical protein
VAIKGAGDLRREVGGGPDGRAPLATGRIGSVGRAGARWAASGREGKEGSAACSALWAEKKGMGRGKEKGRLAGMREGEEGV